MESKIVTELKENNGIKWQLALKIKFHKDNIKFTEGTFYTYQHATTNTQSIDSDYKKSTSHLLESIEKFTKEGSGWVIKNILFKYFKV